MLRHLRNDKRTRGFTLLELMVVAAILGILASTAITSFLRYQHRSKRAEAYANLESIRTVQLAYNTEFGNFIQALPSPAMTLGRFKQNWASTGDTRFYSGSAGAGFEALGWQPEGATFFDYDSYVDDNGDGPAFISAAYGDVDGDGGISVFMYAFPDPTGWVPDCGFCGGFVSLVSHTGPPLDKDGNPVLNAVTQLLPPDGDDF